MLIRKFGDSIRDCYERLVRQDEIKEIVEDLRWAHIIAVATSAGSSKEGNVQYNKWRQRKINELQDKQEEDKLTVFEKVKKNMQKTANTVFGRLKRAAGMKHGI